MYKRTDSECLGRTLMHVFHINNRIRRRYFSLKINNGAWEYFNKMNIIRHIEYI